MLLESENKKSRQVLIAEGTGNRGESLVRAFTDRGATTAFFCRDRYKEALELSKELPDNEALSHYLRATCLNRMDRPVEADVELKKAIQMDPSLKEIAHIDGDVNDLLEEKEKTQN